MSKRKPVQVWAWDDAPEEYRELSGHGGDEDWVALIPEHLYEDRYQIPWLEALGVCDVEFHPIPTGEAIAIGAHA
jgi:hypothetical protein